MNGEAAGSAWSFVRLGGIFPVDAFPVDGFPGVFPEEALPPPNELVALFGGLIAP
jgi:hypothetical protein